MVVFRYRIGSQSVSVNDAVGLHGRLTDRNVAEQELRQSISEALRQAENSEDSTLEVSPEQRDALLRAIG
jgi:hypothetical protein